MTSPRRNRFFARALPSPWSTTVSIFFGILASGSAIALLATSAWLITAASEQPLFMYLGVAIVSVRMFAVSRSVFRYLERLQSHDGAFRMLSKLRVRSYEELIPLAPAGLQQRGKGDLLQAVVRDIDSLQDLSLRVLQPLITAGLLGLASSVFLMFLAPLAGLSLLFLLILAVGLSYALNRILSRRAERTLSPLRAQMADQVVEFIENADVIQVFGIRAALEQRFMDTDALLQAAERRTAMVQSLLNSGISLASGLASLFGLLAAAPLLGVSLNGPFFTVVVLMPIAVFEVFSTIPAVFAAWQQVSSSADRLEAAIPERIPSEIPAEEEGQADTEPLNEQLRRVALGEPLIQMDNVQVSWPNSTAGVRGVSFALARGETLLIQGGSGSGKTTLTHALVGFLAYQGSYRIAGIEANTLNPDALRSVVGLVQQSAFVFNNTLRHNLDFANPEASEADLWQVLERVDLADWAHDREGLETHLGESGALISGGQAQRIGLARALLADFPVLVLDEPTANVQPELHQQLIESLLQAASGAERTVILISHVNIDPALVDQRLEFASRSAIL